MNTCCGQVETAATLEPFIGMGYTTVPSKVPVNPVCDDFMANWSEPIWGSSGRDDLQIIKDMGADVVRTYGIGSHLDHGEFLDRAQKVGLKVLPGFADWPYLKSGSSCNIEQVKALIANCVRENGHDCHDAIKQHYLEMLRHGYTVVGEDGKRRYHPALHIITLWNEGELKLQFGNGETLGANANHAKVVVSAFDGLLSAEDELEIVGRRPLVTATCSYGTCPRCKSVLQAAFPGVHGSIPFLPFVVDYFLGIHDPQGFLGYTPKHDLLEVYQSRWVNSFNTPRPATELCGGPFKVVSLYNSGLLGKIPLYVGEFHDSFLSPEQWKEDIAEAKKIVDGDGDNLCGPAHESLVGLNLFEFQVSYWKGAGAEGGSATRYGFWGLGDSSLARTHADTRSIGGAEHDVWCLFPARIGGSKPGPGEYTNAKAVIDALGGKWPEHPKLCDSGFSSSMEQLVV